MKVETAEDEEGYIMLRGQPPPNYRQANAWGSSARGKAPRRSYKRQHSSLQYRDTFRLAVVEWRLENLTSDSHHFSSLPENYYFFYATFRPHSVYAVRDKI